MFTEKAHSPTNHFISRNISLTDDLQKVVLLWGYWLIYYIKYINAIQYLLLGHIDRVLFNIIAIWKLIEETFPHTCIPNITVASPNIGQAQYLFTHTYTLPHSAQQCSLRSRKWALAAAQFVR